MRTHIQVLACALLVNAAQQALGTWAWSRLNYPGAVSTGLNDVDNGTIVGSYKDSAGAMHGFTYDGTTWHSLDYPGAASTYVGKISDNRLLGNWKDSMSVTHTFLYDMTTATWAATPSYPGATSTGISGIDGQSLVGTYRDSAGTTHGFMYDGTNWTILDYPGTTGTTIPTGISEGKVVGYYRNPSAPVPSNYWTHGFVFNGATWRSIEHYGGNTDTWLTDISGNTILGYWNDYYNLVYPFQGSFEDQSTGRDAYVDWPWGTNVSTYPVGISGNEIVGTYYRADIGESGSFLLTIPEPATLSLLALGGLLIARRRDVQMPR